MKIISNAILLWYMFVTVLATVAPVNVSIFSFVPGLILLWLFYMVLFTGWTLNRTTDTISCSSHTHPFVSIPKPALIMAMVCLVIYSIKYYTGGDINSVITSIMAKESLYNNYQIYFEEENISQLTLQKIPAILSNVFIKLIILYAFIMNIIFSKQIRATELTFLMIICLIYLTFALARGTSFEMFELLVLGVFCLMMRSYLSQSKVNGKTIVSVIALTLLALFLYSYNIAARFNFEDTLTCAAEGYCLDKNTLLYQISPLLADLVFKLSTYFLFGTLYTSHFIQTITASSLMLLAATFLPFGLQIFEMSDLVSVCGKALDCGAMWVPDLVVLIRYIGLTGSILFLLLVGLFVKRMLVTIAASHSFFSIVILYFLFLFLLSLPVGNFISASSSNSISFVVACVARLFHRLTLK